MKKKIDGTVMAMTLFYTLLASLVLAVVIITPSGRAKAPTLPKQPLAVDLWECADQPVREYPNIIDEQPKLSWMAIEELEDMVAQEVNDGARKVGAIHGRWPTVGMQWAGVRRAVLQ